LHGKPVVALAAIFQHSAIILLAKKESGIDNPHEMIGKRVMLLEGDDAAEYIAMFQNEGVSLEQIKVIPSTFNINDLIDGKTDVFNAYTTNEPYYLEHKGISVSIISPKNYGIDFYGDCLFTSEQEIKDHPDQVRAFRAASLRGWGYAMAHPEEIIDVILTKYGVKKTQDHLRFEANAIRKLMLPDLVEIGHMNPGRWRHMADTYVELGMADSGYSLKDFIYNPNPTPDYTWVRRVVGVIVAIGLLISLGFFVLLFFNRKLQVEVTQRRQVEDDLRESEARLKSYYQAAFEGIAITEQGKIIDFNRQFADIFGYERDELIGREVMDLVAEADRELLLRNIRSDFDKPYEHKALKKDGSVIFIEAHGKQIKFQGRPARVTAIHDLTERIRAKEALRESEERLSLAGATGNLGMWGWRIDLGRLLASEKFYEITGLTEKETRNFSLELWLSKIHPDDREQSREKIQSFFKGETNRMENEIRFQHPEKGWIWLYGATSIIERNKEGKPINLVGVHWDITKRKQAEEEREKLINELQETIEEIKTLRGILPLCSFCKKIRDDKGYWEQVDVYIHKHSQADISHSICPDCAKEHYPDLDIYDD
jgi:PAS domain S-box-containing protein